MSITSEHLESRPSGCFDPQQLLRQLEKLYLDITQLPASMDARAVRRYCDQAFARLFAPVGCRVTGLENLPDEPGQIFILNHHKVNPYYTLSNDFQITLDTHYLSALLAEHYPQASSVRVVRQGRQEERAHHAYFDRFEFLYVATHESDPQPQTEAQRQACRQAFYQQAAEVLGQGSNLILCPEGTSYLCQDSPGPFRPGAFRLAASLNPEPYIVPVVITDFDKTFEYHRPAMAIKPPFKLSEQVDIDDRAASEAFLEELGRRYRQDIVQLRRGNARA